MSLVEQTALRRTFLRGKRFLGVDAILRSENIQRALSRRGLFSLEMNLVPAFGKGTGSRSFSEDSEWIAFVGFRSNIL